MKKEKNSDKMQVTTRSGRIARPPSSPKELTKNNVTHPDNNYCASTIEIYAPQTGGKEREATEYVRSKEFA